MRPKNSYDFINERGQNFLHLAVLNRNKTLFMKLAEERFSLHHRDGDGLSPLDKLESSRFYLEFCENLSWFSNRDLGGHSFVAALIASGNIEILSWMKEHGDEVLVREISVAKGRYLLGGLMPYERKKVAP